MSHQHHLEDIMAAVSEEETLEARRAQAIAEGAGIDELRRIDRLILIAEQHEVEAEGEAQDGGA